MEVIIIEDELFTAEDLAAILVKLPYNITIKKVLSTVKESIEFFKRDKNVDLIFCDIELGDGHSFEIFKQVPNKIPVIFCTAYNEYALQAFENNGIGYILKPVTKKAIKEAMEKFVLLKKPASIQGAEMLNLLSAIQSMSSFEKKDNSILIKRKDKIIPVKYNEIALFGIEQKAVYLVTFAQQKYWVEYTLDELEIFCGESFYRANRQFLINKNVVAEVEEFVARRLFVNLKISGDFSVTIPKAKATDFLGWLKS